MCKAGEHGTRGRAQYHHGDLRRHLLDVAREEIARHGAPSVTLSSLARLAGVSQAAPYRHFTDRNALLESVAAEAFTQFTLSLESAVAGCAPRDAVAALALAYVGFGQENMEIYRLIFASRLTPNAAADGPLDTASGAAFTLLRRVVAESTPESADAEAYRLWGQLHGLHLKPVTNVYR